MTAAIDALCGRIEDVSLNGFDLSDDLEKLAKCSDNSSIVQLLRSVAARCEREPSFRQELIDFEILQLIFTQHPKLESVQIDDLLVEEIVGNNRDLKVILGEIGIVHHIVTILQQTLIDKYEIPSSWARAIVCVNSGCNQNKLEFIRTKGLLDTIVSRIWSSTVNFPLLMVLASIIADDDRVDNNPAPVCAREQLVSDSTIMEIREILVSHRDGVETEFQTNLVLTLVRDLSISQPVSKTFALEDGFLKWTMEQFANGRGDKATRMSCAKYIRQLAFADELKPVVQEALVMGGALNAWIDSSKDNGPLRGQLFGTLANLSMRRSHVADQLVHDHPRILILADTTLADTPVNLSTVQCMQFLRSLAKSKPGLSIVTSRFEDTIRGFRNCSDKVVARICSEIVTKIELNVTSDSSDE